MQLIFSYTQNLKMNVGVTRIYFCRKKSQSCPNGRWTIPAELNTCCLNQPPDVNRNYTVVNDHTRKKSILLVNAIIYWLICIGSNYISIDWNFLLLCKLLPRGQSKTKRDKYILLQHIFLVLPVFLLYSISVIFYFY